MICHLVSRLFSQLCLLLAWFLLINAVPIWAADGDNDKETAFPETPASLARRASQELSLAARYADANDVAQTIEHLAEAVNHGATQKQLLAKPEFGMLLGRAGENSAFGKFLNDSFGPDCVNQMDTIVVTSVTILPQPRPVAPPSPAAPAPPSSQPSPEVTEGDAVRDLNAAYQAYRSYLTEAGKEEWDRNQGAWIAHREKITDPAVRLAFTRDRTAKIVRATAPALAAPIPAPLPTEEEADRQLNVAYKAFRNSLGNADREELKRLQLEWLASRDAISDPAQRVALIQQRTRQLEQSLGRSGK